MVRFLALKSPNLAGRCFPSYNWSCAMYKTELLVKFALDNAQIRFNCLALPVVVGHVSTSLDEVSWLLPGILVSITYVVVEFV